MKKEFWDKMFQMLGEISDEERQKSLDEHDEESREGNWEDETDEWWEELNDSFEEREEMNRQLMDLSDEERNGFDDTWKDSTPILKVKKLHKDAVIPKQATDGSAGFDLVMPRDCIFIGNSTKVGTGLAFEIPQGYVMLIVPRSSTGLKTPLRQSNSVGVIDSDYRGEVSVLFDVSAGYVYTVKKGESVAQAMLVKLPEVNIVEVDELSETERGKGGFGSTGK